MTAPTVTAGAAVTGVSPGPDPLLDRAASSRVPGPFGPGIPVVDVMAGAVLAVTATDSLLLAWELLGRTGYHHLPVVDDDGRCVGMLESLDVARALADGHAVMDRATVATLLRGRVPVVTDDATVGDAARILARTGAHAVPVTDRAGLLVGIVTCHDIAAVLVGEARPDVRPHEPTPGLFRLVPAVPDLRG